MSVFDLSELSREAERVESGTLQTLLGQVDAEYRATHDVAVSQLAGGIVVCSVAGETSGFWNRVMNLGIDRPVRLEELEPALLALTEHGAASALVHMIADDLPVGWEQFARTHRLERGSRWYTMGCALADVRPGASALRVGPAVGEDQLLAVQVIAESFRFPLAEVAAIYGAGVRVGAAQLFAAWSGERVVAAAALCVIDGVGHMFGAGTLPEFRGRGAQSALLAARAEAAASAGCERLIFETFVPPEDGHNPSFSVARDAGFEVLHLRENWRWQRGPGGDGPRRDQ